MRGTPAEQEHLALQDGIPYHLVTALDEWIEEQLLVETMGGYGLMQRVVNGDYLRRIELEMQIPLGNDQRVVDRLFQHLRSSNDAYWDLVDYLLRNPLQETSPSGGIYLSPSERAAKLEEVLYLGRSVWTVRRFGNVHCLERRADPTVEASATLAMDQGGTAGTHLENAWHLAYGRSRSPGESYRESVKAVEAAAIPIVLPNDALATLGKVLGEMRAHPARWSATVPAASTSMPGTELVIAMMDALWTGQVGRHGTPNQPAAAQAPEEAEAAVHLAVTLVHWFTSGVVH